MNAFIYLDHNATTPVDPDVLAAMLPWFTEHFGNPASTTHAAGRRAAEAIKNSRQQVAALINSEPDEIIFSSGATESANVALRGFAVAYASKGKHIVSWETEHPAVLDTLNHLKAGGYEITLLPADRSGRADVRLLEQSIRPDTVLVCVMLANNETGVINPVAEIAAVAHHHQIAVCCDATQAAGKIRIDVNELGADLLFLSAHKMYGPKGTGALYIRRKGPRISLSPILFGGGHERGLRPGTLNVPGIVGLGAAAELAAQYLWDAANKMSHLRTRLEQLILLEPDIYINGDMRNRLPNTTNLLIRGIKASDLLKHTIGLAYSFGSACSSEKEEPSHVLKAMGLSDEEAYGSIRLSLGKDTTAEQVDKAAAVLRAAISRVRAETTF
ncbi:MAG TPA: cysteine desulfurase family protein [Bacteroidia bacterium]|nr:cysteine desulfurase family protein [Bacteroidia bacterium]